MPNWTQDDGTSVFSLDLAPEPRKVKKAGAKRPKNVHGQALVAFAYGKGMALYYEGADHLGDFTNTGSDGTFSVDASGVDYDKSEVARDGIYIVDMTMEDDGPGDWPGAREYCLGFRNIRRATEREWADYCQGDRPWTERDWDEP